MVNNNVIRTRSSVKEKTLKIKKMPNRIKILINQKHKSSA